MPKPKSIPRGMAGDENLVVEHIADSLYISCRECGVTYRRKLPVNADLLSLLLARVVTEHRHNA